MWVEKRLVTTLEKMEPKSTMIVFTEGECLCICTDAFHTACVRVFSVCCVGVCCTSQCINSQDTHKSVKWIYRKRKKWVSLMFFEMEKLKTVNTAQEETTATASSLHFQKQDSQIVPHVCHCCTANYPSWHFAWIPKTTNRSCQKSPESIISLKDNTFFRCSEKCWQ